MSGTGDQIIQTSSGKHKVSPLHPLSNPHLFPDDDRLQTIQSAIENSAPLSTLILVDSWSLVAALGTILDVSHPGRVLKCSPSTSPEELRPVSGKCTTILITHPIHLADRLSKKHLKRSYFKLIILCELNEILDRGCRDQVQDLLFKDSSEDTRILITTSNASNDVLSFKKHLKNPQIKLLPTQQLSLARVQSYFINYKHNGWKVTKLLELIKTNADEPTVIICNSRRTMEKLAEELQQVAGIQANTIHGDLDVRDRNDVVAMFISGITQYLIATELAFISVSKDIQNSLLINYDMPVTKEKYINR